MLEFAASNLSESDYSWYERLWPQYHPSPVDFWDRMQSQVFTIIGTKSMEIVPTFSETSQQHALYSFSKVVFAPKGLPSVVRHFAERSGLHFCSLQPQQAQQPNYFGVNLCCQLLQDCANNTTTVPYNQNNLLANEGEVLELLQYCKSCANLQGLPLLPLASNQIGVVGKLPVCFMYNVPSILPHGSHLFITPSALDILDICIYFFTITF